MFLVGFLYGAYWMSTREGLGALGGPVIMMMGAGVAVVVMSVATAWSVVRRDVLPLSMLIGTTVLAFAAAGIAASIVIDNGFGGAGFNLPVALLLVALAGLGVTGWALAKRRPSPL